MHKRHALFGLESIYHRWEAAYLFGCGAGKSSSRVDRGGRITLDDGILANASLPKEKGRGR